MKMISLNNSNLIFATAIAVNNETNTIPSDIVLTRLITILLRERRQIGFVTLNDNLAVSGWVGIAYDR